VRFAFTQAKASTAMPEAEVYRQIQRCHPVELSLVPLKFFQRHRKAVKMPMIRGQRSEVINPTSDLRPRTSDLGPLERRTLLSASPTSKRLDFVPDRTAVMSGVWNFLSRLTSIFGKSAARSRSPRKSAVRGRLPGLLNRSLQMESLEQRTLLTAITINSSENWSQITGGTGGGVPTASDTVTVANGATLTVNVSTAVCSSIQLGSTSGGQQHPIRIDHHDRWRHAD
jgi:hypothetical protein